MKPLPVILTLVFSLLLIPGNPLKAESFEVVTITYNGDIDGRINIVFMGDGYTAEEQDKFIADVNDVNFVLFNTSPFSEYSNFFNVYAVKVISNESGVKHPNTASDCPTGDNYIPTADPDNYFGSTLDSHGVHRALTITHWERYYTTLADNFPQYDQVVILVNTPHHGGTGGQAAVVSANEDAPQVTIHELGHSFGGLGDEYNYGSCIGGEGINYTQETDRNKIKWRAWFEDETPIPTPEGQYCDKIGLYEGANYCDTGSFRPKCDCIMRGLNHPFCEVCKEQMIKAIHNRSRLLSYVRPESSYFDFCDTAYNITFVAQVIHNSPSTIKRTWILDDVPVAAGTSQYHMVGDSLTPGYHTLAFVATDTTPSVKTGSTSATYRYWNIRKGTSTAVSFSPIPDLCNSGDSYPFTEGQPMGGTYSGDFVMNNEFLPKVSGPGTYWVDYTYIDSAGCSYTAAQSVSVHPVFETSQAMEICEGEHIILGGAERYETGVYYDSLRTGEGCDSVIITELTVHPLHVENRTAEICEGESIQLGGEPRSESGTYYDYYKSISGCDSIIATQLVVNPLPEVYLGSDTVITPNDTLVLDAGEGFTYYLWSDGSGEQTLMLFILSEGDHDYYILVTDSSLCQGSDTIRIMVESPGSVQGSWFGPDLEIFPNPASDHLVLRSSTGIPHKMKITFVDNRGSVILEKEVRELRADDEIRLDLSDYKEGVYYLLVNNRNLLTIRKLIKNK